MPAQLPVFLTQLELKALWVRSSGGSTLPDPTFDQAGETALQKVYQAEKRLKEIGARE